MKKRKQKISAYDIAAKLSSMEKEDDIMSFGPKILALMKGLPREVFTELDEKPGLFGYMDDRFYMLRRVRNDEEYGQYLFQGFV